jgi:hypothetical protein
MPNNELVVIIKIERKPMNERQKNAAKKFWDEIIDEVKREQSHAIKTQ